MRSHKLRPCVSMGEVFMFDCLFCFAPTAFKMLFSGKYQIEQEISHIMPWNIGAVLCIIVGRNEFVRRKYVKMHKNPM